MMKRLLALTALLMPAGLMLAACDPVTPAQTQLDPAPLVSVQSLPTAPNYMWPAGQAHFAQRVIQIEAQTPMSGGVLFIGDSITEGGDWKALFPGVNSRNHGVSWDTATGIINRMGQIAQHQPDKIFVLIGTNDLGYADRSPEFIVDEIILAISKLRHMNAEAQIYVQSLMPREAEAMARVNAINTKLANSDQLNAMQVRYINLTPAFAAPDGTLQPELTYDGLHLNEAGYRRWADTIADKVRG